MRLDPWLLTSHLIGKDDKVVATVSRRLIVGSLVAGMVPEICAAASCEQQDVKSLLIPAPAHPWKEAIKIVGKGSKPDEFYNDCCLTKDGLNRWHCIGIVSDKKRRSGHLFHVVSSQLTGPYYPLPDIVTPQGGGHAEMWAPTIVWQNPQRALMIYAHGIHATRGKEIDFSMRVLESDHRLEQWHPVSDASLTEGNVLFSEKDCRDPEVIWLECMQQYLMYYVCGDGKADPHNPNEIHVRKSHDLLHWGEPELVLTTPPGYQAAESVFVVFRDGLYYLWVSGFDYGRMSLYISDYPLKFGDPVLNRVAEQSGHAPEVVKIGEKYWMVCVRVASKFDNAPGEADLTGVYLQPLIWPKGDRQALAKVFRQEIANTAGKSDIK